MPHIIQIITKKSKSNSDYNTLSRKEMKTIGQMIGTQRFITVFTIGNKIYDPFINLDSNRSILGHLTG